ncbi:MAG: tyrosine--tRNA ligase [Armatimonadetes bacterium]|nr:tyrosine--tRNA ligase [Armatimonadota bacterium]
MTSTSNVYDILQERGFVQQVTDEDAVRKTLSSGPVTCYCGFDPTAESLHIGSLVPIMALAHMQRAGHRPIALVGGGTALVGDPSGKQESRPILPLEEVRANARALQGQIGRYVDFNAEGVRAMDNADWLLELRYIDFLRDIGRHFSVNRMLVAEAYKIRLETGLSFLEFNYQILQAYDFLVLFRQHGCALQIGGDDQWGNIVAGVDLIRRVEGKESFGLTFPLITTASGQKMGKTASGAVWLSAERTSPYDFYQYWINTEDADVERFLKLFTFLPMEEVRELGRLQDAEIRRAKEVLAYEATKLAHGEAEAAKAREAARAAFGAHDGAASLEHLPTTEVPASAVAEGIPVVELVVQTGLRPSRNEARRLIQQGGLRVNDERVDTLDAVLGNADFPDGTALLRAGKKSYHRVVVKG